MTELIKVLMERDGLTESEAVEWVDDARNDWEEGGCERDLEEILLVEFGLEPDYLFDFIGKD